MGFIVETVRLFLELLRLSLRAVHSLLGTGGILMLITMGLSLAASASCFFVAVARPEAHRGRRVRALRVAAVGFAAAVAAIEMMILFSWSQAEPGERHGPFELWFASFMGATALLVAVPALLSATSALRATEQPRSWVDIAIASSGIVAGALALLPILAIRVVMDTLVGAAASLTRFVEDLKQTFSDQQVKQAKPSLEKAPVVLPEGLMEVLGLSITLLLAGAALVIYAGHRGLVAERNTTRAAVAWLVVTATFCLLMH